MTWVDWLTFGLVAFAAGLFSSRGYWAEDRGDRQVFDAAAALLFAALGVWMLGEDLLLAVICLALAGVQVIFVALRGLVMRSEGRSR